MVQLPVQDPGGHVGDAADPHHVHAAVPGHDGLGDGGHAHRVGPHGAEAPDLRRGLVAGAAVHHIHALPQVDARLGGQGPDLLPEGAGVDIAHVWEPGAELVQVGADEGVPAGEIDVVGNEHQAPGGKVQIHPAGGVGEGQGPDPQPGHDPHRQGDFLLVVALVVVDAALEGRHRLAPVGPEDEGPGVALHSGDGEAGDLREGHHGPALQPVAEVPQAAAQDQPHRRGCVRPGADILISGVNALRNGHGVFSFFFKLKPL